jgi:hypothetical protein
MFDRDPTCKIGTSQRKPLCANEVYDYFQRIDQDVKFPFYFTCLFFSSTRWKRTTTAATPAKMSESAWKIGFPTA